MKKNKIFQLYGIEYQRPPRKERANLMKLVAKERTDLYSYENYTKYFELIDGSILEIFVYDIPRESELKLYKNENDYKTFLQRSSDSMNANQKYTGLYTYQIIAFAKDEILFIEKEHLQILNDNLKIEQHLLDYSVASLKYLDKYFMRVTNSEEYDNKPVYKALFYYLAIMLQKNIEGGNINFELDEDNLVSNFYVMDKLGKKFDATLDIYKTWTEGPKIKMEFNESKQKKKGKLTLEVLFEVEINKYKHYFPSKSAIIVDK